MIMDIYDGKETMKDRPMKGFIQVLQVLLFFVGGIVDVYKRQAQYQHRA